MHLVKCLMVAEQQVSVHCGRLTARNAEHVVPDLGGQIRLFNLLHFDLITTNSEFHTDSKFACL